jgi:hypothetical protein
MLESGRPAQAAPACAAAWSILSRPRMGGGRPGAALDMADEPIALLGAI